MFRDREPFEKQRIHMIQDLQRRGISDSRVLDVIGEIPREMFIPSDEISDAYMDGPLSIGCGQTISQPYMVALMTECMELRGGEKVLEIGTGSGYQTAILAMIAGEVYTMERYHDLSRKALDVLAEIGISNVISVVGDGTKGLPEHSPYNAIMVTAGTPDFPKPLKDQLADGGRLVAPVGDRSIQMLKVLVKKGDGFAEKNICSCKFVPLIGEYGWQG